ncbi:MAG: hypothetical protein R3B13_05440 [Polyangiaceae bacterium]
MEATGHRQVGSKDAAIDAVLLGQDSDIVEVMRLSFGRHVLEVFVHVCPNPVVVGETYRVRLSLESLDDDQPSVLDGADVSLKHLSNGRYRVRGRIREGEVLEADGLRFDVAGVIEGVPVGTFVEVTADRIAAEFCA